MSEVVQRSRATEQLYQRRVSRIENEMRDSQFPMSVLGYVLALEHLSETGKLSLSSWKQYASAVGWRIEQQLGQAARAEFDRLRRGLVRPERRKRRLKKHIPAQVASQIVSRLREHGDAIDEFIADFVAASIVTGLRPLEWDGAEWADETRAALLVQNAKYKSNTVNKPGSWGRRGNGETRVLELDMDSEHGGDLRQLIDRVLAGFRVTSWVSRQTTMRRRFKTAVASLIRDGELTRSWASLRLYDCRHQFASDAKLNMDLLRGEVAAMMGHRSVITAARQYGRRSKGQGGRTFVKPERESLSRVDLSTVRHIQGGRGREKPSGGSRKAPGLG